MQQKPILAAAGAVVLGLTIAGTALSTTVAADPGSPVGISLTEVGRYTPESIGFDEGGAEIVTHDPGSQRLFVANGSDGTVDVLDLSDPSTPGLVEQVDLSAYGEGITGVGSGDGLVGIAVHPAESHTEAGRAVFLDPESLAVVADVEVGFLPDAIVFSPDGSTAMVANEGEPSADYSVDPEGSVSIVDLADFTVRHVGFTGFGPADLDESVRVFGPGASVAQDFEPENIAFSADGGTAWVTLQENNAVVRIDVVSGEVERLTGLGFKNWAEAGSGFDASNRDGGINLRHWPVLGIPQPDGIASYAVRGETFLVTANEGDARDYDAFSEEARVKDVELCEGFEYDGMDAAELQQDRNLGRLNITTANGYDADAECFTELYAYGTRSFSVLDADGGLVWDSGSEFEEITADLLGEGGFNASNNSVGADDFDGRSDDKGPEPEGLTVGRAYGQQYAFIGLERVGGVVAYRVTDPTAPEFADYANGRDFAAASPEESVDLGPEGVLFIAAEDSPTDRPLLVLSHEVTGTTTVYQVDPAAPGRGRAG